MTLVALVLITLHVIHAVNERNTIGGSGNQGILEGRCRSGFRIRNTMTPATATPVVSVTSVPTDSTNSFSFVDHIRIKLKAHMSTSALTGDPRRFS